ncbi:hypothetical protein [Haladaptatus sp. DYF46]|uniref:hypothetical protein n=1 Tax=Haladaptatus sp. DYF46 TaxID=2886041 RepID=UPI001E6055E5|nr:hypothetical protein [Haladaptatus sp. DYF46]
MDDESSLSTDEFAEYCETQAGLLSGHVETMASEADELLEEVDEGIAAVRSRLEDNGSGTVDGDDPETDDGLDSKADEADVAAVTELEEDLAETRAVIEAKRARMVAFRELADAYLSLAEELRSDVDDGREAMERIVRFEADHDAPTYFDDRLTVYEAATSDNTERE